MKTTNDTHAKNASQQPLPFFPWDPASFSGAARLQADTFKAMMRCQIEALNFLKHRYEQDVKLVEDLMDSTRHGDAFDVCSDFWQSAIAEYSSEGGKFMGIGQRLATDMTREARKQSRKVDEDMAARTVA